jgi:D-glycero-alpha-D-manno-heptose-7-phosphate kinase
MIISKTPLRISLAGGGSDFPDFYREHGGHVVSMAIDRYVYVLVVPRLDDLVIAVYTQREEVENYRELKHELIREAMDVTGVHRGVEIHTWADLKSYGSGLGASSAFTVGILRGLHTYKGEACSKDALAKEACEIEIQRCGKPIGVQDQFVTAMGKIRGLKMDGSGVRSSYLHIPWHVQRNIVDRLMLFSLGERADDREILTEQKANIEQRSEELKGLAELGKRMDDCLMSLTLTGSYIGIGTILRESWELKKTLAKHISSAYIDTVIGNALDAGAVGAKVCGAGGGGHLLVYAEPRCQDAVRSAVGLPQVYYRIDQYGTRIMLNAS